MTQNHDENDQKTENRKNCLSLHSETESCEGIKKFAFLLIEADLLKIFLKSSEVESICTYL